MPLQQKYDKLRTAMCKQYGETKGNKLFTAYCKKNSISPESKAYIFVSNEFKSTDGEQIEGYISTGDKDLVNDIVTPNCMVDMLKQLQDRNIKLDIEHESFIGDGVERELNKTIIPIGRITDTALDSKGIKIKCALNKFHSRFSEVKNSIKEKFLDAFSIAYVPTKVSYRNEADGSRTRLLEKVNLLNVAFTGNPANPNASFTNVALKSLKDNVIFDDNMSESEINELIGGIDMTEEKKVDEQPKVEEKPEVKPEAKPVEVLEEKSIENVEAKALAEKISALTNSVTELKAIAEKAKADGEVKEQLKSLSEKIGEFDKILSQPQFKSRVEQLDEARKATEETKSKGPIDQIR